MKGITVESLNDIQISYKLAIAIGWRATSCDEDPYPDVLVFDDSPKATPYCAVWFESYWRKFDYRDPAVLWPIAAKFDCFPRLHSGRYEGRWEAYLEGSGWFYEDTPEKAVAFAVIRMQEAKNVG